MSQDETTDCPTCGAPVESGAACRTIVAICDICNETIRCGDATANEDVATVHAACVADYEPDDRDEVYNRMRSQELRTWAR